MKKFKIECGDEFTMQLVTSFLKRTHDESHIQQNWLQGMSITLTVYPNYELQDMQNKFIATPYIKVTEI